MTHLRAVESKNTAQVGWDVRVLMLNDGSDDAAADRLAGLGGRIDTETEVYTAMAAVIDDPRGYGVFVMDTDAFGGLDAGLRVNSMLRAAGVTLPIILVGTDCDRPVFPDERSAPIILKAPLSMVALQVGFEHALQDRAIWRAA